MIERAAQLMIVGFEGTEPTDRFAQFVQETPPAGIVFFRRNFENTEQIARLVRQIRRLFPTDGPVPLFAIDQEGGRVRRLKPPHCPEFTQTPSMGEVAASGNHEATFAIGREIGADLARLGFNLNFAPVLDVNSNPNNPIIGDRAFGPDPETVIRHALALAQGLTAEGVIPCGKHFPGHGDTDLDSHLALPILSHSLARLQEIELPPFKAAIAARFPILMTAHVVFTALDKNHPATLSTEVIPRLLRDELHFDGVVISDDLEMAAVAAHYQPHEIASRGLQAGIDCFLVCRDLDTIIAIRNALADALEARDDHGASSVARLNALRATAKDFANARYKPFPAEA